MGNVTSCKLNAIEQSHLDGSGATPASTLTVPNYSVRMSNFEKIQT